MINNSMSSTQSNVEREVKGIINAFIIKIVDDDIKPDEDIYEIITSCPLFFCNDIIATDKFILTRQIATSKIREDRKTHLMNFILWISDKKKQPASKKFDFNTFYRYIESDIIPILCYDEYDEKDIESRLPNKLAEESEAIEVLMERIVLTYNYNHDPDSIKNLTERFLKKLSKGVNRVLNFEQLNYCEYIQSLIYSDKNKKIIPIDILMSFDYIIFVYIFPRVIGNKDFDSDGFSSLVQKVLNIFINTYNDSYEKKNQNNEKSEVETPINESKELEEKIDNDEILNSNIKSDEEKNTLEEDCKLDLWYLYKSLVDSSELKYNGIAEFLSYDSLSSEEQINMISKIFNDILNMYKKYEKELDEPPVNIGGKYNDFRETICDELTLNAFFVIFVDYFMEFLFNNKNTENFVPTIEDYKKIQEYIEMSF